MDSTSRFLRKAFGVCITRFLAIPAIVLFPWGGASGVAWAGVNTWTTNGPAGRTIVSLAIAPSDPATLYASSGGVFKSTNSGQSWSAQGLLNSSVYALAVDPRTSLTVYAATASEGVFKSTNGGSTWNSVNSGINREFNDYDHFNVLVIDPSSPNTLYGGGIGFIYRTTNGGGSWSKMEGGLSGDVQSLAVDPQAPATVYAGTAGFFTVPGGFFKSTDSGRSWSRMGLSEDSVNTITIDPSTHSTLYTGTGGGVFKSSNGGGTWTHTALQVWINSFAMDPATPATVYAGGYFGGVFKSVDGGQSWTFIDGSPRARARTLVAEPSARTRLHAGTVDGVFEYEELVACTPDPTTLCLNGGRFKVATSWVTADGHAGTGRAVAMTADTGYFTFFDPANVEILVKVVNGCGVNSRFWVFAGGLTDVNVLISVTDNQTGAVRTYTNLQGTSFQPIQDTSAFPCGVTPPAGASGTGTFTAASEPSQMVSESRDGGRVVSCVGNATTLCLNTSRYLVQAHWFSPDGASGAGQVINLTGDTGAFWFFSANNVEIVIKILNGCGVNARYWTFAGGLTNVNVVLTVTDTQTGTLKTYTNAQGIPFQPIQDTGAFGTCP